MADKENDVINQADEDEVRVLLPDATEKSFFSDVCITPLLALTVLLTVITLGVSLSTSLKATDYGSSDYVVYVCGCTLMFGAILGGIYLFVKEEFWGNWKTCSTIEFSDWAGLVVLMFMAGVSFSEIILTLAYTVNAWNECGIGTKNGVTVILYGSASSGLLLILLAVFAKKAMREKKAANDSTIRKEKIIISALIFATLLLGLKKFVDHCSVSGIPFTQTLDCKKLDKDYLNTETYLRPVIVQFCVFSIFLLVKIVSEDKNDDDVGLLPLSKSTCDKDRVNIDYGEQYLAFIRPFYKKFIIVAVLSLVLVLPVWIPLLAIAEISGNGDLYATTTAVSFALSAVFCILVLGILRYYRTFEEKRVEDNFASASIVITSSLLVVLRLLSARANDLCYNDSQFDECKLKMSEKGVSPKLQVISHSFGIAEIVIQTFTVLTVRRLKHSYWLPIVHENNDIEMPAKGRCFPIIVYPFLVTYLSLMNLVRYAVDLALEGPIRLDPSQTSATVFLAESLIYGEDTWIFLDNVLYSLGSLFRLISFFSFLQLAMKVMFNTFFYWYELTKFPRV